MSSGRRSALAAGWRIGRALWHILRGAWIIRSEFGRLTPDATDLVVREWTRQMLDILGVTLVVRGMPPSHGPVLQVANHISWLDILVMNGARPSHFVSKSDVKHWPVVGTLATGTGTLYIERENRRDAMRVVHQMAEHLRGKDILSVFPEGTTGDGQTLLPFHANLIQAAIAAEAPVLPVGLSFVDADSGQRHDGPLFIGDTTLLQSLWNTLRSTGVQAVVHYGEPQRAQGRDRRTWAQDLRTAVMALREG
ncbi:MAG: 1-acyl-sn-glycerol-3-phosphate acyltransferase [Hydrogenophaga sp.]|nr:1-acyl-sn-glycerol-3-phosphate acyltransferase [Hydrogenophaga sp.]